MGQGEGKQSLRILFEIEKFKSSEAEVAIVAKEND